MSTKITTTQNGWLLLYNQIQEITYPFPDKIESFSINSSVDLAM